MDKLNAQVGSLHSFYLERRQIWELSRVSFDLVSDISCVELVENLDFLKVLFRLRVVDGEQFDEEVSGVVGFLDLMPMLGEVGCRVLCLALIDAVAIHKQVKSVEEGEGL